jgi:uncharacterized membrane protein
MRKLLLFEIAVIIASAAVTAIIFPHLPNEIPCHWNVHLQPDNYLPKWAVFVAGPGVLAAICALTRFLPWLCPNGYQVDTAYSSYRRVMLIVFSACTYFYAVILWASLRSFRGTGLAIAIGYCVGLTLIGNVLGKVQRNFFVGVITPWTIVNERVWHSTHRLAAWMWVGCGILALLLASLGFAVASALALAAGWYGPKLYSLVFYKVLERRGEILIELSQEEGNL